MSVAIANNGKIYAMGGYTSTAYSVDTVWEYDLITNSWVKKSSMPTGRIDFNLVAANNGMLYAIGGEHYNPNLGTWSLLSTVDVYNPVTDTWTARANLPTPRAAAAAVAALDGKIYVFGGGFQTTCFPPVVEAYNPVTDTWERRADMPTARSMVSATLGPNGRIYVIGGEGCPYTGALATTEEYDPVTNAWQARASMPTAREGAIVMTAPNGRIYAIGGKGPGVNNLVEEYDPVTDSWLTQTSMPTARYFLGGTATSDGRLYAIGGNSACCSSAPVATHEEATINQLTSETCIQHPLDLVSWWPGQRDGEDLMGKNDGTPVNGVSFTTGQVGQAFNLDGINDYMAVPDHPSLNPGNTITVAAWIKRYSPVYSSAPIITKKADNDRGGYSLESHNGDVSFWVNIIGAGWKSSPLGIISPDQWYHVAGVYDGTAVSLYVNGSMVGSPTPAPGGIVLTDDPLMIGADLPHSDRLFKGLIDEAQIFNRALSAEEIQAIYTAGSAGQCGLFSRKVADQTRVSPGGPLNYTIELNNYSDVDFNSITINDPIPPILIYKEGSLKASSGVCNYQDGVITWSGSVGANSSMVLSFETAVIPIAVNNSIVNSAVVNAGSDVINRSASVKIDFPNYLPLVSKSTSGLAGKVTMSGTPAAGVSLDLRFYDGVAWSTLVTTTTGVDGTYNFSNIPALAAGQAFYVRYLNTSDSTRVYTWHSGMNTTYNAASMITFDTFDIANIVLLKPDSGTTVKLPYTFTWTKRPATATDSYEFELFDPNIGDPYFTTSQLGYVNSYNLAARPANFLNGVYYGWDVGASSPDGGFGYSYFYYVVKFTSTSGGLAGLEMKAGSRPSRPVRVTSGIPEDQ